MYDKHQNILNFAESKKSKGDGINAVLTLMKDVRDFQDKIDACIEAQAIEENKQKIEKFDEILDQMYATLLEIAEGGIKSVRQRNRQVEIEDEEVPSVNPTLIGNPSVHRLP